MGFAFVHNLTQVNSITQQVIEGTRHEGFSAFGNPTPAGPRFRGDTSVAQLFNELVGAFKRYISESSMLVPALVTHIIIQRPETARMCGTHLGADNGYGDAK